MGQQPAITVQNFSHICVGVSDIETSRAFYTAVLGMDVVFDVELEGAGLDSVTGGAAQHGRMVGGLIGDVMVELLSLGSVPAGPSGPHLGYTNMSFRVDDLDTAYRRVATGGWSVVLVGDASTVVPALEHRVAGPVNTVAL